MATNITELINFLDYTVDKNFFTLNGATARKTACKNLFSILDDDQKTVEYVKKNLDSIIHRLDIKNKGKFTGQTMTVYKARVNKTIEDFEKWTSNKAAWEKEIINNGKKTSKKPISSNTNKKTDVEEETTNNKVNHNPPNFRNLSLPISSDFEVEVKIPSSGLTRDELYRLGMFLFPYCKDLKTPTDASMIWPPVAQN